MPDSPSRLSPVASRNVLFISYYFPPSGGPGVQRPLKFVRYLPEFGWNPVVLTVDPAHAAYPDLDADLLEEIPAETEVIRTRSWDPYGWYSRWSGTTPEDAVTVGFLSDRPANSMRERIARWVRANLFIPDARVGWVPYALRAAQRRLNHNDIDAIISTGPPHSTHLIGRAVHRRHGLPWLADFRDPWTDIDYREQLPMTGPAKRLNERLERSVLREASGVVVVSPAMHAAYLPIAARCETVFNGYDEADFEGLNPAGHPPAFIISHVGNMNAARNPEKLWDVLGRLQEQGAMPELRIRLVGNVDRAVMRRLEALHLDAFVERIPYLPHREAVHRMVDSAVLLLVINRVASARGIVTGKLFEYLAAGRPILGIGPVDGDAARILEETRAGSMIDYNDIGGLERFVQGAYEAWKERRAYTVADPVRVEKYSRRHQSKVLAGLLNDVAGL